VARLAEGFVLDDLIECPMHNGRFHIPTGRVDGPPACEALRTYPVRLDGEAVQIQLPE
jgi:nitrite reductase/ring-hydroxylating ferredoxin subunit